MKEAEFEELEKQYYEEKYKREKQSEAKEELERVKHDLECAIQMNGWIDINKIIISVDRGVRQGQDGNGGYENEQLQVEIKDYNLFEKCMRLYINELECRSGLIDKKDLSVKDINRWLSIFKLLKNYEIEKKINQYVKYDYWVKFGVFNDKEMKEIYNMLYDMGAKENE